MGLRLDIVDSMHHDKNTRAIFEGMILCSACGPEAPETRGVVVVAAVVIVVVAVEITAASGVSLG